MLAECWEWGDLYGGRLGWKELEGPGDMACVELVSCFQASEVRAGRAEATACVSFDSSKDGTSLWTWSSALRASAS